MAQQTYSVGIVGVSGYAGMELVRLLARHPGFKVSWVSSDRWAGVPLDARMPVGTGPGELTVLKQDEAAKLYGGVDLVFLCTPPEVSIDLAPKILAAGARVVDLSGGFRLPASDYPKWYGFEHGAPELLAQAVYSLPEATGNADAVATAQLLSNPGCYPTAASLPLVPLLRAGLVSGDGIVIDAKSGTSGAGRKASEALSFCEVADNFKAYKVLKHQHTPEIERIFALSGCKTGPVVFTTHLLPIPRGILATAYARIAPGIEGDVEAKVQAALREFAAGKPFLRVVSPDDVTLHAVVGTNRVVMGARVDVTRGIVVVVSAEDNLVKGAAGQALQNANLMFGFTETDGLLTVGGHKP